MIILKFPRQVTTPFIEVATLEGSPLLAAFTPFELAVFDSTNEDGKNKFVDTIAKLGDSALPARKDTFGFFL